MAPHPVRPPATNDQACCSACTATPARIGDNPCHGGGGHRLVVMEVMIMIHGQATYLPWLGDR